jgi:ribonuclease-3
LSAEHGLGVPEYLIADEGPDHMKTFTAQVRVGDRRYGNGVGRSKKEAEQAAAETAYGELAESLGVSDPIAERVIDEVVEGDEGVAGSAGD